MGVHVEIVPSLDSFAVHYGRVFGPDGDEVLGADAGVVILEKHQDLLAQLTANAILRGIL